MWRLRPGAAGHGYDPAGGKREYACLRVLGLVREIPSQTEDEDENEPEDDIQISHNSVLMHRSSP